MKTNRLFLLILILLLACEDNYYTETFSDPEYPSRYCVLTDNERSELFDEFDYQFKQYFEIDSFGFLDRNWDQHRESDLFEGSINSQEDVLQIAKEFLQNYSKFVGIADTSKLVVQQIQGTPRLEEEKNKWFIRFENQVFEGIEVYDSSLGVYVSSKGVYETFGHWYADLYLPNKEDVTFEEAKKKLVGKTFEYYDWTGGKKHTVSMDDFYTDDIPAKKIIPFRNRDCIELRLCWMITSRTIWNFYVDVLSGELIYKEQTVLF